MAKLTVIEGIAEVLEEKLKKAGVGSVEKLLEVGGTRKGRQDLAAASGIEPKRLLRFVNYADLMRINGIGGEYAELLEAAGVDSVAELAQRRSDNLHTKMVEANEKKSLVRQVAAATQVEQWIEQAKKLPKAVHH